MPPESVHVTVGLPTYNRAGSLKRAIESVLAQSHSDLELVISDNASDDATPEVCRRAADRDPRVRYVRQRTNRGLTGNFNTVLRQAGGRYVMVLADDDWLEADYIARCVEVLETQADFVCVTGGARFYRTGKLIASGARVDVLAEDPAARVRSYFGQVRDNVAIYGLIRRTALTRAMPMRNCLAGDWLLIGRLAMAGRVCTVPGTWVNRSSDGTSESFNRTVRSMGLTRWEGRHPHLAIAGHVFADIARDAPAYAPLGTGGRTRLAAACAGAVLSARPFNVIEDALAPYLNRRRLRCVDRALRPIAQRRQR
jgi:GT2 family glycosyltransferase